jgi:hypothetical protein
MVKAGKEGMAAICKDWKRREEKLAWSDDDAILNMSERLCG